MTILKDISIIWSFFHVLILFSFLFESRYTRKKTLVLSIVFMLPLLVLNVALYFVLGSEGVAQVLIFSCTLPSLLFFFLLAKNRDGRFLFSFCLADTVAYGIIVITLLLEHYLGGGKYILMLIGRLLAFPAMEVILWKYLRRYYLELQQSVKRGWGSFACVGAIFYVLLVVMSSVPVIITERPDDMLAMILILLVMPLMYFDIFRILIHQQKLLSTEEESRILRLQSAMLTQRAEYLNEMEKQMRISRHDLRHQLLTAAGLVQSGRTDEAVEYLTQAEQALEKYRVERWSNDPVLDAVFSVYFRKAKAAGIRVDADIAIPDVLPVDVAELSTVFANALENAVQACMELPQDCRWIRCKCLATPQLMFQISNSYKGNVAFDRKGRPISRKAGHGIGTRSIAAFCEKHDAHCEYKASGGVFTLRMLIY